MRVASRMVIMAAAASMLTACGGDGADRSPTGSAALTGGVTSGPHPDMPQGFAVAQGPQGVAEFNSDTDEAAGMQVVSYVTDGPPRAITRFYEDMAVSNGMTVTGRVSATDLFSVSARREAGAPRVFSASASQKGELTNVVVNFTR